MGQPWERLPDETPKAYAAFCIYRDLGPTRSLHKALEKAGKGRSADGYWWRWMKKYRWYERAMAYDEYVEQKAREAKEEEIKEMVKRHAALAVAFQEKVAERLKTLNPDELSPSELARWLEVAAKLERLSRGEPTEIGKQEVMLPAVVEVTGIDEHGRQGGDVE